MKFNPRWAATALFVFALNVSPVSQASLVDSGSGLIYDNVLDITWLANANLAATNTFGVAGINANGSMNWSTAQSWIAAMNIADYLGFSDWRLPITLQPDSSCSNQAGGISGGDNCTGSEMGQLFYDELGGTAGSYIGTTGNSYLALFHDIQSNVYWSGTEHILNSQAWEFSFSDGSQLFNTEESPLYAWAVHAGEITVVPVPSAVWLFGGGLMGLVGIARRKTA